MTSMLLLRHGQSEWNAAGRWQGQADPPLSDLGREQAHRASERLGAVDVLVASDLQRAVDTAQILSGRLGVGPVVIEPRLRERNAGEWTGLTRDEIEIAWPGYLEAQRRPPGYEPEEALRERVSAALEDVAAEFAGGEVVVVTHGGVIYTLERQAELPFEVLPNLGGRWARHGSGLTLGERVLLVGDDDITTVPAAI